MAQFSTVTDTEPLKFRHFPANIANPAQSDSSTTQSEAQGAAHVHTLSSPFRPQAGLLDSSDYGSFSRDRFSVSVGPTSRLAG